MKRFLTCLTLFLTLAHLSALANILIADNSVGADHSPGHVYANIQLAHAAAVAGDTIHVIGSGISHGDVTIDKQLFIYGAGHHPDPLLSSYSELGHVTFEDGSDNSVLSGFRTAYIIVESNADGIKISDCWMTRLILDGGQDYVIEGNFIAQTSNSGGCGGGFSVDGNNAVTLTKFRHNVFQGTVDYMDHQSVIFDQNLFLAAHWGYGGLCGCTNVIVTNNIFLGTSYSGVMFPCSPDPCLENNNIEWYWDSGSSMWVGDGDPHILGFEPYPAQNTIWFDFQDLTLGPLSSAIGAGDLLQDVGVLGFVTTTPYDPAGYPPIPRISNWTSPSRSIQAGGMIEITIDAYSND